MQDSENYELDPNFAVVCSFLERFGKYVGENYANLSIEDFKSFLEAETVDETDVFVKLHLALIRKIGNKCSTLDWMKAIIKFCRDFPDGDDQLIKEKGYTNVPIKVKLRVLKNLCEDQFEYNDRFNRRVNEELEEGNNIRHEPVGKDKLGRSYWFMQDTGCGMRLFRGWYNELTEDETWNTVCSEVDELENFIETLEETEDLTHEDPHLPQSTLRSPKKTISHKDIWTAATEDAANAMFFATNMTSPRFFKPPKLRSKQQILKEEDKYDLPHCDVVLRRLLQTEIDKYKRTESSPKKRKKYRNGKELTGGSKSEEKDAESEAETESISDNTEIKKSKSKHKETVKSNNEIVEVLGDLNKSSNSKADEVINLDTVSDQFNESKTDKKVKGNKKADSGTGLQAKCDEIDTIHIDTGQNTSGKSKRTLKESNDHLKNTIDLTTPAKATSDSEKSNTVSNPICIGSVEEDDSNGLKVKNDEKSVSKETKCDTILIGCKGDAGNERENETERHKKVSTLNHSIQESDCYDNTDQRNADSDSKDEKDVFDNAIKNLIILERNSVDKSKIVDKESFKDETACVEQDTAGSESKKAYGKDFNKGTKQDRGNDSNGDVDQSADIDKKVIDDALKDLMQLEEMINKGSPFNVGLSSPNSCDIDKSEVKESKTKHSNALDHNADKVVNKTARSSDGKNKGSSLVGSDSSQLNTNCKKVSGQKHTNSLDKKVNKIELSDKAHPATKGEKFEKAEKCLSKDQSSNHMLNDSTTYNCTNKKDMENKNEIGQKGSGSINKTSSQLVDNKESLCSDTKCNTDQFETKPDKMEISQKKGELPFNDFEKIVMSMMGGKIENSLGKPIENKCDNKCENPDTAGQIRPLKKESEENTGLKTENDIEVGKQSQLQSQNAKLGVNKRDEKKQVSLLVGDEMIQIEEASDDSDSETESATVDEGSATDTASDIATPKFACNGENDKVVLAAKVQKIIENNAKIVNLKGNDCTDEKDAMKTLYSSNASAGEFINPNTSAGRLLAPKVIFLPSSQVPISKQSLSVRSTATATVNNQKTLKSMADRMNIAYVPVVSVSGMITTVANNILQASQAQTQTVPTILFKPALPSTPSRAAVSLLHQNPNKNPGIPLPKVPAPIAAVVIASGQPGQVPASSTQRQDAVKTFQSNKMINQKLQAKVALRSLLQSKPAASIVPDVIDLTKQPVAAEAAGQSVVKKAKVKNMVIVVGQDGVQYNKETGKPFSYPSNKKLVVAGPRGKFYDQASGYEVNFPMEETIKHVQGKVYLVPNVSLSEEVMKQKMAGTFGNKKRTDPGERRKKKRTYTNKDSDTSDEEFLKMLEENSKNTSEEGESDDSTYDYDKISQRVKAAQIKKSPSKRTRRNKNESDDMETDEEVEESEEETVPLILGRNAKRVAARKRVSYAEPDVLDVVEMEEEEVTDPCKLCDTNKDPASILLCDKCDNGYHMWCLSPPLPFVPLEDWFCPKCEHEMLIESLKEKLDLMKQARKRYMRNRDRFRDRISQKTVSVNMDNIVLGDRRSTRGKKEVNYNEASYDKIVQKAVKEYNNPEKNSNDNDSSGSDTDSENEGRSSARQKVQKRPRVGERKSRRLKKADKTVKRRKLTSLDDDSGDSGSEYVQTDKSDESNTDPDTEVEDVDRDDAEVGGLYYTSSGRQTKHVSYTS